jgi:hypothetical protein
LFRPPVWQGYNGIGSGIIMSIPEIVITALKIKGYPKIEGDVYYYFIIPVGCLGRICGLELTLMSQ